VGENDAQLSAARLLIFSADRRQRQQGTEALNALLVSGYKPTECAYWLVVGLLNNGEYRSCRTQIASLVRAEPSNERAAALLEVVKERIRAEGQRSWLVAGGVALAVGALLYVMWGRRGGGERDADTSSSFRGGYGGSHNDGSTGGYYRGSGSGSGGGGSSGSTDIANNWKSRYGR
jgi:uncharacterized membrane protein YgcG